jgi:hypothetical protein
LIRQESKKGRQSIEKPKSLFQIPINRTLISHIYFYTRPDCGSPHSHEFGRKSESTFQSCGTPSRRENFQFMTQPTLIEQELSMAEAAWKIGNEGKARVCARRAVALANDAWLENRSDRPFRGDAMAHLSRIQQDLSLPPTVREAAERLSTTVTRKDSAPFTTDPIGDARIIIAYLIGP